MRTYAGTQSRRWTGGEPGGWTEWDDVLSATGGSRQWVPWRATAFIAGLVVAGLLVGVGLILSGSDATPATRPKPLTALVYSVDISNSDGSRVERAAQIDRAVLAGRSAAARRLAFALVVVGGAPADTQVLYRVRADRLTCDGDQDCQAVTEKASTTISAAIRSRLALDSLPARGGSPLAEAHEDTIQIARSLAGNNRVAVIWDSDMEQATLGAGSVEDPPANPQERVWLVGVDKYAASDAKRDFHTLFGDSPPEMHGISNIYLGVGNRRSVPPGSVPGQSLDRPALWLFTRTLCDGLEADRCERVVDIESALDLINSWSDS